MGIENELGSRLSTRARRILENEGYQTVADIRAAGAVQLGRAYNCGPLTVREIEQAIGGWGDQTETDRAQAHYDRVKKRYLRVSVELTTAKAKLTALKNPPPKRLTIEEIVASFREQLGRHCTGYIVDDVLRVAVSTRNANWVELEAKIGPQRDYRWSHWTLMPLDRFFATYLTDAMADVIQQIDEIEALGPAGRAVAGHQLPQVNGAAAHERN